MQFLIELEQLLQSRYKERPDDSYTTRLFDGGRDRILKKIGEEAGEVIIAAKNPDRSELIYESADLLFHLQVLLVDAGISIEEISQELETRHQPKKA
ncbi:MAG: phosphoribosyl-ATP diphosphatase [Leptospiraceae bacterium]|nr:phosphoribosyl-ATP diphosphatase [Leptospiraceae bacterium]